MQTATALFLRKNKPMKQNKQTDPEYCIWDFNGTILDDVETGIRAVNHLLAERGLKLLGGREEYRSMFGFPVRTYYERLGFDFDREPYEVVAPLWVEQYLRYVSEANMFEDVPEVLAFLRDRGIRQVVLSATEQHMLVDQLSSLGITAYFDEILGLDNIHAISKFSLAEEWRSRHPSARVLWLGDTDHDCSVGKAIGAECMLITRGHQSPERLKALGVPMFDDLLSMYRARF